MTPQSPSKNSEALKLESGRIADLQTELLDFS